MARAPTSDATIRRLRGRLARIDRRLVRTLAARERAQWELLERKRDRAISLVDPDQEERVRRRAREWAQEAGGDADLAESVVSAAVTSGKARFQARPRSDSRRATAHVPEPKAMFVPSPAPRAIVVARLTGPVDDRESP